ncbi:MAG: ABC transporter permease [bacterium]
MAETIRFGFRNLARRRSRTVLTVLGVLLAIGFTVGLLSISEGFMKSFTRVFSRTGPELFFMPKGESSMPMPMRHSVKMPQSMAGKIASVDGVKFVEPVYQTFSVQQGSSFTGIPTMVMGIPPESFFGMRTQAKLEKGRALREGDTLVAVLGNTVAKNTGSGVGDEIELLTGARLKVVGVLAESGYIFDYFAYAPLKVLQYVHEDKGKVHYIMIKLENVDEMDVVMKRIEKKFPGYDVLSRNEMLQDAMEMMSIARIVHLSISAFALLIGVLFVACTMIMSISERVREFATIRAIGAPRSYVMKLIMSESLVLSLIGGFAGCWLGVFLSYIIDCIHGHFVGETLLHTFVSPRIFAAGIGIAVLIGTLAGIIPALIILRKNLADSLKYE